MNGFLIGLGALMIVVGGVWTLQGVGVLPGSVMSGVALWAFLGPIVALAGAAVLAWGFIRRRRGSSG
ncbi:hypothetical protein ACFPER_03555 [Agromyces aurantiacus]|uniref:Integral membrane protein n=1 Tax=Agromyces aurantiacus TaxID=165814 RepID=A0ABV9R191_9MICO|nr:hypothetical protein [Agromyces aurantiacus]MBM7506169.1 membrane protein implicated in regulation of membrane protease activity [Agromyces aurantiacus]